MGCFLGCFGGAKDQKQQRRRTKRSLPVDGVCPSKVSESYKPLQLSPSPKKITTEAAHDLIPELRENQEQGSFNSCRKKVTFDLNVKTYEDVLSYEDPKLTTEDDEGKEHEKKLQDSQCKTSPNSGAYPLNHRYQNCTSSDDEDDAIDSEVGDEEYVEDSDFDDEEDEVDIGVEGTEEESYESFFSLPVDKERQQNSQEVNSPIPIMRVCSPDREPVGFNGNARHRTEYVHSVLNPVENLSKWKEVKARAAPTKNPYKENINSEMETKATHFTPEPINRISKPQKPTDFSTKQEVSVDASLSNWLVSSPQESGNSVRSNSPISREDRPILGALTVDDIKQSSVTSSPRRSPSRSPDEIPILGTVGSYWNTAVQNSDTKGIPNTTSKYSEDKRVNWQSTPFEVRLERALNRGAAESCI